MGAPRPHPKPQYPRLHDRSTTILRDNFDALTTNRGGGGGDRNQHRFAEKSRKNLSRNTTSHFSSFLDENKKVVEEYGVYGQKKLMGRSFLGTNRVSFRD